MTTITIFGVGLMGGSLALCFKGKPGLKVIGHSNNPQSVEKYRRLGIVDEATTDFKSAAEAADFIFICVPVGRIGHYLEELGKLDLKEGCIITDVGSTKAEISEGAQKLELKGACFIGGHPMAGSERSGVEAATADLYENAYYVLTPGERTPETAYAKLVQLLQHTRAQIIRVDAREHDGIVGAISHLPHVVAAALVNQVARYNESNPLYQLLAAGGFRDITRIASSDPVIWRDILLSNRDVMLRLLDDWNEEIAKFIRLLEAADGDGLEELFRSAQTFRNQIPERRKGMIMPVYELFVDVSDHPGVIGQIASLLGEHRINLRNIHIHESRADVPGVLCLSFREQSDLDRAAELLQPLYPVRVR